MSKFRRFLTCEFRIRRTQSPGFCSYLPPRGKQSHPPLCRLLFSARAWFLLSSLISECRPQTVGSCPQNCKRRVFALFEFRSCSASKSPVWRDFFQWTWRSKSPCFSRQSPSSAAARILDRSFRRRGKFHLRIDHVESYRQTLRIPLSEFRRGNLVAAQVCAGRFLESEQDLYFFEKQRKITILIAVVLVNAKHFFLYPSLWLMIVLTLAGKATDYLFK